MEPRELTLISVDDHIIEPPTMFDGRLPRKYQLQAPRVIEDQDGYAWVFGDSITHSGGLNAVAGRPPEEYGQEPQSYDEMRVGCYDVHARVRDMSANGVLASLNFPSFPRFCGQFIAAQADKDPDLALAVVRAYNDWHLEEWAGAYPDRFIPCSIPPLWDPQAMAAEIHRLSAAGSHAVSFSMNPYALGLPSLHDAHWNPFWAACADTDTVVCMHIGSGAGGVQTSPDAPVSVRIACMGIDIYPTAADLVWSPLFQQHPNLKVALAEGGIGWIPYFLERADYTYRHHSRWTRQDLGGRLPSEVFRDHIVTCFIDDAFGLQNLDQLNPDMVTWECDYPHSDSTWPESPEVVGRALAPIADRSIVDKVTHLNAMRLFHFDPFALRTPASATVGALRQEVAGHDVSVISLGVREGAQKVTQGAMAARRAIG